jgi:AraC-like DNA-binding protein
LPQHHTCGIEKRGDAMQASCSARLVRHSLSAVPIPDADREYIPPAFWSVDPDSRVPLSNAHAPLLAAADRLSDEALGLKLGSALRFGVGGVFDYVLRSAATLRDSVEMAQRFARLVSDSMCLSFETFKRQSIIRFDVDPVWTRVVADFGMSAWFKIHIADQLADRAIECWFPYRRPEDTSAHEKIFGTTIKFDAPFFGFVLPTDAAAAPLPGADPVLHAIHCERASLLLTGISLPRKTTAVVRQVIERELEAGSATADRVASALHMSRSTMARRLGVEGTGFNAEMDAVRRERALRYIRDPDASLAEVAFRSGFSHVESFHRAFKRWTGHPPSAYRERLSGDTKP